MRNRIRRWLAAIYRKLTPAPVPPDARLTSALKIATERLAEQAGPEDVRRRHWLEFIGEMIEARRMGGVGPWTQSEAHIEESGRLIQMAEAIASGGTIDFREAQLPGAIGAFGDIELALQNVDWRREINFSWLEFSRWGIQQIILISRLYYIKNPLIRRLTDVCAAYVFARGVEVTTDNDAANDTLDEFWRANAQAFGHVARIRTERAKDLDGNIFWVFFPDTAASGTVKARLIDPIEIQEIFCDPVDGDTEWYYRRCWTETVMDASGVQSTVAKEAWYPALNFSPPAGQKMMTIGGHPVMWTAPVYHRKCGTVGKWRFGCPRAYPALDWAKETRRYLEACAAVAQTLAQFGLQFETKGGQQAIEGIKQQMQTSVGPQTQIWDTNPPAIPGASWISGPGTKLEAFKTQGAGLDPEKCRQYKLMVCMVWGVPESFLGDIASGNLATATSLDRPTETVMLEKQQEWVEDLTAIATYVLSVSKGATGGKLRESIGEAPVKILECRKKFLPGGRWVYEAFAPKPGQIEIKVNFPAVREADMPAVVGATVQAMTLANKSGQVVGIDEREGVMKLAELVGIDDPATMVQEMYPDKTSAKGGPAYNPSRTVEDEPAPIPKPAPVPGGQPQNPQGQQTPAQVNPAAAAQAAATPTKEALRKLARGALRAVRMLEAECDAVE
jgi:hypothetical protein